MHKDHDLLLRAIAFAARAHRHQLRKDGLTPYASHPFRVAMIAGQVFDIRDPKVLAAAVLHDTIEDTTTDYDDLAEHFGSDVANWVSSLTKEMHLPEAEREERYKARLAAAPWPVVIGKLADIFDNLTDSVNLSVPHQRRTILRSESYLAVFKDRLSPETAPAFEIVQKKLDEARERHSKV